MTIDLTENEANTLRAVLSNAKLWTLLTRQPIEGVDDIVLRNLQRKLRVAFGITIHNDPLVADIIKEVADATGN